MAGISRSVLGRRTWRGKTFVQRNVVLIGSNRFDYRGFMHEFDEIAIVLSQYFWT
jgi:hypothetical protein